MNALFIYLLKSALCMTVLYAIYWFFLQRDTFFNINRAYLLAMVILSILLPLLPLHMVAAHPSTAIAILLEPVMITPKRVEQTLLANLQWMEIAMVVYLTGVVMFMLRFVLQLVQISRITRRFGVKVRNGHRVVFVDRGYSPFSFFNLVYINEYAVPAGSLPTILEHERIHIRQHHTFDMILLELATAIQWFNPVIWLAGREMKTIHEYLADEGVLQNGISRPAYQQMILNETMGIQVNNLANNFNVSLLKKRIAMMTKSKSKTWAKSKVLFALPAMVVLLLLLAGPSKTSADVLPVSDSPVINPVHLTAAPVLQDKQKQETQTKFVPVSEDKSIYTTVEKLPSYTGGHDAMVKFLIANVKYPELAMKNNVQGKVYVTFVVRSDGSVTDVKILRGIGSGCDEEAARVIKLMPKWNPGMEKGKPVNVQFNLPINFALDGEKKAEPKK